MTISKKIETKSIFSSIITTFFLFVLANSYPKLKIFFILVLISANSWLSSLIIEIKQDGTGDFLTIQEGIDSSVNSDTVLVYPGTYYENLDFNGHNITLASLELTTSDNQYIHSTIIDGAREESCIRIHNGETNARVQGFTVQNGYGTLFWSNDGGGFLVHDYSTAFITNCIIKDNVAGLGAGIYARHGVLNLSGLLITENSAGFGGAIYVADESTVTFSSTNRCNIHNNNAGKGADLFGQNTGQISVIVDTFSIFDPCRYFAEYTDGSSYTFNILNNWMELVPHDLYVAVDGDDEDSGLSSEEPLKNISWAVRKIQADEQNPRTVHVAAGTYSHESNQQIFPIGCKEYVSIIGENMGNTILYNDYALRSINGFQLYSNIEISNLSISNSSERYTNAVMFFYDIDYLKLSNIKIQNNANINIIFYNAYVHNDFINLKVINNIANGSNNGFLLSRNIGFMKNCIIENNFNIAQYPFSCEVALQLGADDDFLFENCVFTGNYSDNEEGRIIRVTNVNGNEPTITFNNCLISDNYIGSEYVFQNFNYDGLTEFNNCTFSNNTATSNFYNTTLYSKGDINMTNTIMNDNTEHEIFMADDTINGNNFELNLDHCNIKNGDDGVYNQSGVNFINWLVGNIYEDPLFLNEGNNPYQLSALSPCIDAGTPDTTGLFLPPWDLLHNYRVWDGDEDGTAIIDIGCYEYGAPVYDDSLSVEDNIQSSIINTQMWNFPNPFKGSTTICFSNTQTGVIKLEIFNIKGQKVKILIDCFMSPGRSEVYWDGRDTNGKIVSDGIYFYKLKIDKQNKAVRKMILIR